MVYSSSLEFRTRSAIHRVLWNKKINCRINNGLPSVTILRNINLLHSLPAYTIKIHFNIIFPSRYLILVICFLQANQPKKSKHL
jgi:hypothetical protein